VARGLEFCPGCARPRVAVRAAVHLSVASGVALGLVVVWSLGVRAERQRA